MKMDLMVRLVATTSRDVTETISIDSYEYTDSWTADLSKPKTYELKHLSTFTPVTQRYLPAYYFIPVGYFNVINNLLLHDIEIKRLKSDIKVKVNEFKNFDHEIDPEFGYYEGHTRRLYSVEIGQNLRRLFLRERMLSQLHNVMVNWQAFS